MNIETIRITEIFYSLQGETRTVGLPTVFVRLTGCPLRCKYCDTAYAFSGGINMERQQILAEVAKYQTKYVTVTGGEPLAQKSCLALLNELCDLNYIVSLETSGALDISQVDNRVVKVVDVKTPGSGEAHRNLFSNFSYITANDQLKFVICNQDDYEWAKNICMENELYNKCEVLFSSSFEKLELKELADWILADRLQVRFQLQIHKYIWGDKPGC